VATCGECEAVVSTNYKLDRFNNVTLDGATLPVTYNAGVITSRDPSSPIVKEFIAWVALGNVPAPADVPTQAQLDDAARLAAIDAVISGFAVGGATLEQLKAMDNVAFDLWWTANTLTLVQSNVVLKLLMRSMLRRVL
jgi:hypothetical protein